MAVMGMSTGLFCVLLCGTLIDATDAAINGKFYFVFVGLEQLALMHRFSNRRCPIKLHFTIHPDAMSTIIEYRTV